MLTESLMAAALYLGHFCFKCLLMEYWLGYSPERRTGNNIQPQINYAYYFSPLVVFFFKPFNIFPIKEKKNALLSPKSVIIKLIFQGENCLDSPILKNCLTHNIRITFSSRKF